MFRVVQESLAVLPTGVDIPPLITPPRTEPGISPPLCSAAALSSPRRTRSPGRQTKFHCVPSSNLSITADQIAEVGKNLAPTRFAGVDGCGTAFLRSRAVSRRAGGWDAAFRTLPVRVQHMARL